MGQTTSRIKDFTFKCFELLPTVRYRKLSLEQNRKIVELEKVILSQRTELQILKEEKSKMSDLESRLAIHGRINTEKLYEISSSLSSFDQRLEKIREHFAEPKTPSKIGELGEDFVFKCLKEAFPNNDGIVKTAEKNCGDILFRVENSDKVLMIEVKNHSGKGYISGINKGKDFERFFTNLHNSSVHYSGAVLVSLNGPVDINTPSREPRIDKGKPYVFIDNLKQFPDPVCLLHVVMTMMIFMIRFSESLQNSNMRLQLDNYNNQTKKLLKIYKDLLRSHTIQKKSLDSLREEIVELGNIFAGKIFH